MKEALLKPGTLVISASEAPKGPKMGLDPLSPQKIMGCRLLDPRRPLFLGFSGDCGLHINWSCLLKETGQLEIID